MNHLLKSSKIKQSMQVDQESVRETESLDQIRTELAKLADEIKSDSQHDQRQTTLEGIMLRVSAEIDRIEEMESAEDSEDKAENDRMSKMCMDMQTEIDSLNAERLADAHILGNARADLAKMTAMCDAEKRARVIAENALAAANVSNAKKDETILALSKQESADDSGWHITPIRDSADNTMRYEVMPKSRVT